MRSVLEALVLLVLAASTLLAALVLMWAVVGLFSGRLPFRPGWGRPAAAAAGLAALVALSTLVWFGWGGPFGGGGLRAKVLPDTRRAELGDHSVVRRVEQALPRSNRGARPRVEAAPSPPPAGTAVLYIAANDAGDPDALRRGILADAWRAAEAVFRDPALGRVRTLRLAFTHPAGRSTRPGAEPVVAVIDVDRATYLRLAARPDAHRRLAAEARVRWLPPLDRR